VADLLIIEADSQLAGSYKKYLSLANHTVRIHPDPQTAIVSTDSARPDIIILNFMLAGRSGLEFLYELRSYPEWQTIPVVLTGSYSQDEIKEFSEIFKQLNVHIYLHKPTTPLSKILEETNHLLQPIPV
jgi:DNA-binding response OmpR family regulator